MKIKIGRTVIRTVQGDITKADFVDAIVNSAGNPSDGGSGVNNAILLIPGANSNAGFLGGPT